MTYAGEFSLDRYHTATNRHRQLQPVVSAQPPRARDEQLRVSDPSALGFISFLRSFLS
jgi:hypothetical protein